MTDAVAAQHGRCDVIDVAGFAAMRSENEGIEASPLTPDVQ